MAVLLDAHREAVRCRGDSHIELRLYADSLRYLYELTSDSSLLHDALNSYELILQENGTFDKLVIFDPPGVADVRLSYMEVLYIRYCRFLDTADLERIINMGREVARMTTPQDKCTITCYCLLAKSLVARYELHRRHDDLDEIITIYRRVISLHFLIPGNVMRISAFTALIQALFTRSTVLDEQSDLDEAISLCYREYESPYTNKHTSYSKTVRLCLLSSLFLRGTSRDVDQAITILRDNPTDPLAQARLAFFLVKRHDLSMNTMSLADLNKAIKLFTACLEPIEHMRHHLTARYVSGLGSALLKRYIIDNHPADLSKSIYMLEKAYNLDVELASDGISMSSGHDLAQALLVLYTVPHEHQRTVAYQGSGALSILDRLFDSEAFGRCTNTFQLQLCLLRGNAAILFNNARVVYYHLELADLLKKVVNVGHNVESRIRLLRGYSKTVTGNAITSAILSGELLKVVEVVESMSGLFWQQALSLNTELDVVRIALPEIAEEFSSVRQSLKLLTFQSDEHRSGMIFNSSIEADTDSQNRRNLAARYHTLMSTIRSHPGLENFMLPSSPEKLISELPKGFMVILNLAHALERCEAVIIRRELKTLVTIRLTDLMPRELMSLANRLQTLISTSHRSPARQSSEEWRALRPVGVDRHLDDKIIRLLRILWEKIVLPVFSYLRLEASSQ